MVFSKINVHCAAVVTERVEGKLPSTSKNTPLLVGIDLLVVGEESLTA